MIPSCCDDDACQGWTALDSQLVSAQSPPRDTTNHSWPRSASSA
ncbi:hypothetical protein CORC01_00708 [Colletotrichum orchidophilum]|uniref:Uncharacterized protein n=1 Tax=Colletotrichum orchidophilum TaxID=1209926 RepID=A0A1G4BRC7_9PEZI|nr:uncharacterized protein CORC01_00708 [Colletotrichum orchidophilum]OHF03846.1 hypothetical protein CORC01_00708 [Colletotrichum orchidophilum]